MGDGIFSILFLIGLVVLALINIFSTKYKMKSSKKKLHLLSLISAILFAFIPGIGYRITNGTHYIGYPAEIIDYHGEWIAGVNMFGIFFNYFFYYLLFAGVRKILKGFKVPRKR
ncbi:hypothetical protein AB1K84_02815 [Mesobacillus foraminis]|uniref:hypothetical protein n=1 Tax=Mesobacillus foraminis TaxID=279826 RepID=UPI0039A122E4